MTRILNSRETMAVLQARDAVALAQSALASLADYAHLLPAVVLENAKAEVATRQEALSAALLASVPVR